MKYSQKAETAKMIKTYMSFGVSREGAIKKVKSANLGNLDFLIDEVVKEFNI